MSLPRLANTSLLEWKGSTRRKPLILRGARQVGKTTLVKEFAKTYSNRIFLNLEKQADLFWFEKFDDAKELVEALFISKRISSESISSTILFLDEIQAFPKAIQMLRYFYEEVPELHVIAAGSLLEFSMKEVKSFPVGRVEYLHLHPLNFVEFLDATGYSEALKRLNQVPVRDIAHPTLMRLFNQYAIIGGMPEVVERFRQDESIIDLPKIYESIWRTYRDDVEKYASNETSKRVIKHVIKTAHLYLDQRIKFQNFGNSNYRSREVVEAMQNLDDARVIQVIYPTTDLEFPIKPDLKKSPRLQFLDTGLVNHSLDIQAKMLGLKDLSNAYKGVIIPHMITQELISLNSISYKKPNFWVREKKQSSAEVDLVFPYGNRIIPIEIKPGSKGKLKSLHQFIERTNHPYAVRIYAGDFKIENAKTPGGVPYKLMNLPYYLGTKIPEYIEYFVNQAESE